MRKKLAPEAGPREEDYERTDLHRQGEADRWPEPRRRPDERDTEKGSRTTQLLQKFKKG